MLEKNEILALVENQGAWSMSDFQSKYFVVNSQVTDYRRVRQALLEIETRIAAKKQIERNIRKCDIQIKIKLEEINAEENPLKKQLIEVDIDQLEYDISVFKKKLIVLDEELTSFCNIVQTLVPNKTALEECNKHDEEKEREYWITRMGKQACMDLMALGRIGQGNLDSIAMMPLKDQEETIKLALKYSTVLQKAIGSMEGQVKLELQNFDNSLRFPSDLKEPSNVLAVDKEKISGETI